MITDKEFLEEMLRKGLERYNSKRQLAFAIGLKNAQTLHHWIERGKVPGDKKPLVASVLKINWLETEESDVLSTQLNHEAIDFAGSATGLNMIADTIGVPMPVESQSNNSRTGSLINWSAVGFAVLGDGLAISLLSERLVTSIKDWESENNHKLSNTEFAKICNVSKQTVGDWLKGRTQTMTGEALLNGSDFLGVSARWLCSGVGEKKHSFNGNKTISGQGSLYEETDKLNYSAVDFAVLGIIEFSKSYPKTMATLESRQRAFKYLYKAWHNEEIRKVGAVSLLELYEDIS
jgi:transcriptional regulator with XRE-family HTH domain